MYYLDDELSLQEAHENKVFRVYGGDSSLEGGYVTPERPANPIDARGSLALSQHDWVDDDGNPIRNLASEVAEGTIYTDDDGHIVNLDGEVTDHELNFTTVEPTSDQPGGGLEYHLEDDFYDVVEVENIEPLQHQPTEGWNNYIEVEDAFMNSTEDSTLDSATDDMMDSTSEAVADTLSVDEIIEDEEYFIQRDDTDDFYMDQNGDDDEGRDDRSLDDDWWVDDTHEEDSVDDLIEDEIYEVQADDLEESYYAEEDSDTIENDINNDYDNNY